MSGLYIHIPFCQKACHYCNFHFSTQLKHTDSFVQSLIKEIELTAPTWHYKNLETIYWGGGTPSILSLSDLASIIKTIERFYQLDHVKEWTIEANPDNLSIDYLKGLRSIGFNRLSIGIQSFNDVDLKGMNRAHDVKMAHQSIENSYQAGFNNFSIDLMYNLPNQSNEDWLQQLRWVKHYDIKHFSAYGLTIEPKTALATLIKKGKIAAPEETVFEEHFKTLLQFSKEEGYRPYELSNFALPGYEAIHNSGYWHNKPYLGLGPSAHSFDGTNRWMNLANNALYQNSIAQQTLPRIVDERTPTDALNEWIMTQLRLDTGLSIKEIQQQCTESAFLEFQNTARQFIQAGDLEQKDERLVLTDQGKLIADRITASLFLI